MLNEMKEKTRFLKVGDTIIFDRSQNGLVYNLQPKQIYNIQVDSFSGEIQLKLANDFNLPEKVYHTEQDKRFMRKVLRSYDSIQSGTTGVMLCGLKGSGKTVLAKSLAMDSNLPILLLDQYIHPRYLNKCLQKIADIPVCIIFDEVDKLSESYDDDYLLKIMDGVDSTGKKLFIFTANNTNNINEYMKDRCSRIRYWKLFKETPQSMINSIIEDKLLDCSRQKEVSDFIRSNVKCLSFDNISSFIDEINLNPEDSLSELFADMNLSKK